MNCKKFGDLTDTEICAVLQLTYQLIASANFGQISEADDPSINVMMSHLGFSGSFLSHLGDAYWNDAMEMNPYSAFNTVSRFSTSAKDAFKEAIMAVANKSNTVLRKDIARQIFGRVGIS